MAQHPSMNEAGLHIISASDLLKDDPYVKKCLLAACQENGFFYLDYRSTALEKLTELYGVAKDFFELSLEEKLKYDVEGQGPEKYDGYKIAGRSTGPLVGKRDGFEAFTIPNNSLFSIVPGMALRGPSSIQKHRTTIKQSVELMDDLSIRILKLLSSALCLPPDRSIESCHRRGQPSTSALSLLRYLPDTPGSDKAGHMAHTDIGTLAIVLSMVPGLQVQLPGDSEWRYIAPKPGHAIINVGDCLTFLSNGRLPSILHRVVPAPGTEEMKYSLGYFLRPEFEAILTDREGKVWRSHDWHCNKFKVFRASLNEQKAGSYLTGKTGYLGLADPDVGAKAVDAI
ncbi:MAG: hypothetical protein ASARMPREDX12_006752 [Alectoria sarmentosa]|nr:MAG: hypothetical protein ASARMPREDX12_006752 [Alectoria sarmentosa]